MFNNLKQLAYIEMISTNVELCFCPHSTQYPSGTRLNPEHLKPSSGIRRVSDRYPELDGHHRVSSGYPIDILNQIAVGKFFSPTRCVFRASTGYPGSDICYIIPEMFF